MNGKTVLITGGSSGIGRATAKIHAEMGARVIITGQSSIRTQQVANDITSVTGNQEVIGLSLDLGSFEAVHKFGREFLKTEKRLDVLINNAAYLGPRDCSHDGFEKTFAVNHFGHFLLTHILLERLKACAPSRVVCVTSASYRKSKIPLDDINWLVNPMKTKTYDIYKSYGRSKLGNVLFMEEFNKLYAGSGVTSYAIHPGVIRTSLLRNWPGVIGSCLRGVASVFFATPEQGATAVVKCSSGNGLERRSGQYFDRGTPKASGTKPGDAERLWNISMEYCLRSKET